MATLLATVATADAQGRRPDLWMVTIGVSQYQNPVVEYVQNGVVKHHDLRLATQFAAKDAQDLARILQAQEGKLFDRREPGTFRESGRLARWPGPQRGTFWSPDGRRPNIVRFSLIDARAQAEVRSAPRSDTPPSAVAAGFIAAGPVECC